MCAGTIFCATLRVARGCRSYQKRLARNVWTRTGSILLRHSIANERVRACARGSPTLTGSTIIGLRTRRNVLQSRPAAGNLTSWVSVGRFPQLEQRNLNLTSGRASRQIGRNRCLMAASAIDVDLGHAQRSHYWQGHIEGGRSGRSRLSGSVARTFLGVKP